MIFVKHYLQTEQMATEQRLSDQCSNQESSASSFSSGPCLTALVTPLQHLQNNFLAWLLLAGSGAEWARKVLQLRQRQLWPVSSCGLVGHAEASSPVPRPEQCCLYTVLCGQSLGLREAIFNVLLVPVIFLACHNGKGADSN